METKPLPEAPNRIWRVEDGKAWLRIRKTEPPLIPDMIEGREHYRVEEPDGVLIEALPTFESAETVARMTLQERSVKPAFRQVPNSSLWLAQTPDGVVQIAVREPYTSEPDGLKYVLTGARGPGIYDSWDAAVAAVVAPHPED